MPHFGAMRAANHDGARAAFSGLVLCRRTATQPTSDGGGRACGMQRMRGRGQRRQSTGGGLVEDWWRTVEDRQTAVMERPLETN